MCSFRFLTIMIYICLFFIFTTLPFTFSNVILPEYEHCHAPLGMESGAIPDHALSASSSHDMSSVGPQMGRIRSELEGGAWCPEKPVGINSYEYLQIDLGQLVFINAIETQGRFGNGQGREYAEYYQIQYQRDNQSDDWITYIDKYTNKSVLNGNINTYLAEKRSLSPSILARRVRIVPHSTRWRTVCMRVELYGCPFHGGIISYATSPSTDRDRTYDGGIGKLVDGVIGGDDRCWLGWNSSPITIDFYFDQSRHFKSIQIYTLNNKYHSVQVQFDEDRQFDHRPQPVLSSISTVFLETIDIKQYGPMFIGKHLQIRFHFRDDPFLLTEIKFDNELVTEALFTSTAASNTTTMCSTVFHSNHTNTLESSSVVIFTFEWLTICVVSIFSFGFILLFIIGLCHRRHRRRSTHRRLRQNSHPYYKSSQMTATTSGSCVSTTSDPDGHTLSIAKMSNQRLLTNNYDDVTSEQQSMGSYIYPITSTTSLLQTSPPSSICKGEQYAVIDGNYSINPYKHWPGTNTFHYASLDIGQISQVSLNRPLSLFNSILPIELPSSSKCSQPMNRRFPADVDQSKLMALRKLSETAVGEIYLGNYLVEDQSQCVLIKAIKAEAIQSSRDQFLNELETLSRLNHPHLACLYAVHYDLLYLIQEHSHFGTLQDYSRSLINHHSNVENHFQKMNIYFAYQLASALQYLSQNHFIHGDIATRNCLLYPDLTIKLTDCAIALTQYRHEYWVNSHGQLIPLRWIAPEVLTNNATIHSDIYSFGVTLWEIWSHCSTLPYGSLSNEELYQRLMAGQSSWTYESNKDDCLFHLSVPPDCPKEIYDLFCECWHRDGMKRPNIDDITLYFRRQIDASRLNPVS